MPCSHKVAFGSGIEHLTELSGDHAEKSSSSTASVLALLRSGSVTKIHKTGVSPVCAT